MPAAPHNCRFKGYNSKEKQRGTRGSREVEHDGRGMEKAPRDPPGFDAL